MDCTTVDYSLRFTPSTGVTAGTCFHDTKNQVQVPGTVMLFYLGVLEGSSWYSVLQHYVIPCTCSNAVLVLRRNFVRVYESSVLHRGNYKNTV